MFDDVWKRKEGLSWLDIGAGYGEVVEAVTALAPPGSKIEGLEPMEPKREVALARGLTVRDCYLSAEKGEFDFVSLINVFSHIPDFPEFLGDLKKVLPVGGEFFLETGDFSDLDVSELTNELNLPDHLVFANEKNLTECLTRAGFTVVGVKKERMDTVLHCTKLIVKTLIGRKVSLAFPYRSRYRAMMIRAQRT